MAEIIKLYKQSVPASRFIGKRYGSADRVDGTFGHKWQEWFQNGWFGEIEKCIAEMPPSGYEDGDAYIGLMREQNGEFEYWVGIFAPVDTTVPDGFSFIDLPQKDLGVCWIYGPEYEVYVLEGECAEKLTSEGYSIDMTGYCFERYACPRFTSPDEKGNVILDMCFLLN